MLELTELLKLIPTWMLIAIVVVLAFMFQTLIEIMSWFFKDFWHNRKGQIEKHEKALLENTMAIVKLQVKIENLTDALILIPKMKADIDWAHEKLRSIQNGEYEKN